MKVFEFRIVVQKTRVTGISKNNSEWDRITNKWNITMEIPVMSLTTLGFAIAIPPTALVTETAGVNTPSAIVKLKYYEHLGCRFNEKTISSLRGTK